MSSSGGSFGQAFAKQSNHGAFAPVAWVALLIFWVGAGASYFRSRQRRALLEAQTGLDSLVAMNWREFEMLVGEAFRRQGYLVEETGLGGADGGIDLILRKDGRTELAQCKQWRTRQIKAQTVREMWGLLAHHRADSVKIVCVGEFTRDAAEFADGKAIELINGRQLLSLVQSAQSKPVTPQPTPQEVPPTPLTPPCPRCGSEMVERTNRQSGQRFWGCSKFPACKGTQPATP